MRKETRGGEGGDTTIQELQSTTQHQGSWRRKSTGAAASVWVPIFSAKHFKDKPRITSTTNPYGSSPSVPCVEPYFTFLSLPFREVSHR
ncbi:hypothetical protein RRG08_009979 [Elysia crispata]|uniref:Uncharacterized protein n=1 Tax=Elysia crispata TaxID=231223 RepID=A0AAE1B5X2_9GAST|nr:hypothetical protein RRG08_009979 [Elysia crispata]